MKRALAFVCAMLTIAAIVGAPVFVIYRRIEPASLRSWIARVERPGWRLLHSSETETHWFAVFDAGDDRLAFCSHHRGEEPRAYQSSLTVTDAAGKDVADPVRRVQFIDRDIWIVLGNYRIIDGSAYPVRPGHAGPIRLVFRGGAPLGAGGGELPVLLEVEVPWGTTSAQRP